MQRLFFLLLAVLAAISTSAADIVEKDIQYRPGAADAYAASRCHVDVARPDSASGAPVVVWFHGGGLTSGSKTLPAELLGKGYVVVSANYRLMPAVPIDSCIADAAAPWPGHATMQRASAATPPRLSSPAILPEDTSP